MANIKTYKPKETNVRKLEIFLKKIEKNGFTIDSKKK